MNHHFQLNYKVYLRKYHHFQRNFPNNFHHPRRLSKDDYYQVMVAENARDAKAIFLSHLPALVLLDLGLPDQDGMYLLGEMKMEHPEIPVYLVDSTLAKASRFPLSPPPPKLSPASAPVPSQGRAGCLKTVSSS